MINPVDGKPLAPHTALVLKEMQKSERNEQRETLMGRALSSTAFRALPETIQAAARFKKLVLIPPQQRALFRYVRHSQFWLKTGELWHQVPYSAYEFASRSSPAIALAPYKKQHKTDPAHQEYLNKLCRGDESVCTMMARPTEQLEPYLSFEYPNDNEQLHLDPNNRQVGNKIIPSRVKEVFEPYVMQDDDSVASLSEKYELSDAQTHFYLSNPPFSPEHPPQMGDSVTLRTGWLVKISGWVANCYSFKLSWRGPVTGTKIINVPGTPRRDTYHWHTQIPAVPGRYRLTISADGLKQTRRFEILKPPRIQVQLQDNKQPLAFARFHLTYGQNGFLKSSLNEQGKVLLTGDLCENAQFGFLEIDGQEWENPQSSKENNRQQADTPTSEPAKKPILTKKQANRVHTVTQGENLLKIARQYGFYRADTIYQHPRNAEFKQLRPDPDVIYPGDQINIPAKQFKSLPLPTDSEHVFQVNHEREFFRVKIEHQTQGILANKPVEIKMGEALIKAKTDRDGMLEIELEPNSELIGNIAVYDKASAKIPSHRFNMRLGELDPVETLSGVQARCNLLGYQCGIADGIMGSKTRAGVKAFQTAHQLDADSIPGPITKNKLKTVYGC